MTIGATLRRYGLGIAGGLVVGGAGVIVGQQLRGRGVEVPVGLESLPLVALTLWLAVVWHELGHVAGGWLAGFRLQLFAVGPLRFERRGPRYRWSFNRSLGLWGGFAATSPDPASLPAGDALRRKMLLVVAGGPVASLAGGLLGLPLWVGDPLPPHLAFGVLIFAVTSIVVGVCTLVPVDIGSFVNDGRRLLDLGRNSAPGRRWLANVALAAVAPYRRPREWPADLVEDATDGAGADLDGVLARWMRHAWHLDRGEIAAARDWLGRALADVDRLPAPVQSIVQSTAADFYARIEPDPVRARRHLAACSTGFVSREALSLIEAGVRLAEGDAAGALAKVREARPVLDGASGSSREYLAEILDGIERRAQAG